MHRNVQGLHGDDLTVSHCSEVETEKELCVGSDYRPSIPCKFKENNQGFVSWCHANLLTDGTETELDLQVQTVSQTPAFLYSSSVFVALLSGKMSSVFIFTCLVCQYKPPAKKCLSCIVKFHFILCPKDNRHTRHTLLHLFLCISEASS